MYVVGHSLAAFAHWLNDTREARAFACHVPCACQARHLMPLSSGLVRASAPFHVRFFPSDRARGANAGLPAPIVRRPSNDRGVPFPNGRPSTRGVSPPSANIPEPRHSLSAEAARLQPAEAAEAHQYSHSSSLGRGWPQVRRPLRQRSKHTGLLRFEQTLSTSDFGQIIHFHVPHAGAYLHLPKRSIRTVADQ